MTHLSQVIMDTIRSVGHHIGQTRIITCDGDLLYHVSARDARTDEKWAVTAPSEYSAAFALAEAVGFELEDG